MNGESSFFFKLVPALLLLAIWLLVGGIFLFKGDGVDKPNRMASFYGYTVCLIALIVSLFCLGAILNAMFERANPLQSERDFGVVLTSFESYKATYRRDQAMFDRSVPARPDTASETSLRQQYDALARDRIGAVRYRTTKTLTTSTIFLLISVGLFLFHWRWVRRLNGAGAAAG